MLAWYNESSQDNDGRIVFWKARIVLRRMMKMTESEFLKQAFGRDLLVTFPKDDRLPAVGSYPKLAKLGRYVTHELAGGVIRLNSTTPKAEIQKIFSEELQLPLSEVTVTDTIPTT
ncbi:hypothetical protein RU97_GL002197 [Enterococcus canis]|uniref:Uncharacterized protein n=2 Tax=Enterococcus canis TaxID=214095 RepID=A0A1L8REG7_9ENTE|nr:hypothetical protein RU97_GL002197 [Enterococcus canis]